MDEQNKLIYFLKQPTFLIIVGYLYIISTINFSFTPYDSGIILTGGMRILNGELPYKDFFTMYAPGQFYLDAILEFIYSEVLFIRFILSFIQLGIIYLLYKISNLLFDNKYYIYSILLASIWLGALDMWNRAIILALFFNILLVYNILNHHIKNKELNYIKLALIISLIMFFRHDVGVLTFIVFNIYLVFNKFKDSSLKIIISLYSKLFIGFIPLIIFSVYLLFHVDFATIYEQLITIPKEVFPKYRSIPFPNPFQSGDLFRIIKNILLSSAFFISVINLVLLLIIYIKNKKIDKNIIIYSLFLIPLLNQMIVRSELEHALPATLFSIPIIFYSFDKLFNIKYILLLTLVFFSPNMFAYKFFTLKTVFPTFVSSDINNFNNIFVSEEYNNDLKLAINYIRENTEVNEKIYVGLENHDIVFTNEASFYFMAERIPGTRYHELHPGITTTKLGNEQIIFDLEKNSVNFLVLYENVISDENNLSTQSSGEHRLDIYIAQKFNIIEQFGKIKILKRN